MSFIFYKKDTEGEKMNALLIGNVIAFIGSVLMVVASYAKNKKNIILIQAAQISLLVVSNVILGGITGAIINAASVIRNILCYKSKLTKFNIILISAVVTILSLAFNNLSLIGLLPLISTLIYTAFMNTKSTIKLKFLILLNTVCWGIYDLAIRSYTSAIFEFIGIFVSIISIYQLLRNKKEYKF